MKTIRVRYYLAILFCWTILIVSLIIFDFSKIEKEKDNLAKNEARANFNKDQAIRFWASSHGGVYVPIDSMTQPNPALSHIPERDIETPSGKKLTLMNPAYMIRQLNEYFAKDYGVVGHITSKILMRPENIPDEWELNALNQFEKGIKEVSEYSFINGKPYLRLMQPMITEQSCLKCHAHQGYKIGDVRGGIGISIPMNLILERTAQQKKRNIILFSLLWVIGFIGLSFGYKKLDNSLQKQEQVEKAIKVQNKELIKTEKKLKKQNKEYSALNKELAASEEKIRATNEELLIAKEKAEESDRLKSAFLANMSHEIRTPMNGILGFSDLLKEPNLSGEEQKKYIEIIEKSGARMLNIINDIIDISKIESGQIKLSMSETNVNDKLEYIYTFFKPEAEKKGLKFSLKNKLLSKEATIITDPDKFLAILINLVKNAIKYTNEGTIEFGCENKGKYFEGFVKDTGIGIPKDRQEAIFERFIQADIEDKMARQGAGLGLAITKAYTEMLGGKIWLESEEGIGSTFYFTLPYKTEPEEKIVVQNVLPSDKADSQISNLKILIVEDDETSEMLISINVKEFCNKVIKARTGAEAIEACRNIPDIDLILMDIQMPDLNGYEATRQIRQFNKDVVIIAQTAFGLIGDRGKSLAAGCNDYISKPINKTELLALMQKYFNK